MFLVVCVADTFHDKNSFKTLLILRVARRSSSVFRVARPLGSMATFEEHDAVAQISQAARRRDESPERPFDVVVFGATGFTGELTAAYIARSQAEGKLNCRWAIAGRSREKLDALTCVPASVPRIVADSSDRSSLDEMARQTKVIASTVGPYTLYGSELVAACVAQGTHYCDLTGEVLWARDMIRAHHQAAEAAGCKIVFHCGFDCIPVDIGSFMASSQLPSGPATKVLALATKANGSASGGTLASLQEITRKQREERAAGYPDDPYALAFDIVGSAARTFLEQLRSEIAAALASMNACTQILCLLLICACSWRFAPGAPAPCGRSWYFWRSTLRKMEQCVWDGHPPLPNEHD